MRLFATSLFACFLIGCPSAPAPAPIKSDEKKKIGKEDLGSKESSGPPAIHPVEIEPPVSPDMAASADGAPAWFDSAKIEHAKVLQPKSQAKIGPRTATSMVLELKPEITPEACMTAIRAEMAKTLGTVPEAVGSDDGRLTLQGKTGSDAYTIVCGAGKAGQTTMFLSYEQ